MSIERRMLLAVALLHGVAGVAQAGLTTVLVASGLEKPLFVTAPPGDTSRIFIVGQEGTIQIMRQQDMGGTPSLTFLDISSKVSDTNLISHGRSEQGLLGLAFHPDYANNGYFYVHYTERGAGGGPCSPPDGDSIIARYSVTADPDVADPDSELVLLQVSNQTENHNAGMLAFWPPTIVPGQPSYLYITIGMHAEGTAPLDLTLLRGKMLRIDVDGGSPYAIPPDNPYVGAGGGVREEIWASGLRHPWRFSFDRANGDLYIGDVGRNTEEELDYQPSTSTGGENYGYNTVEGNGCVVPGCNQAGLTLPIHARVHDQVIGGCDCGGCPPCRKEALIGGYVYRGTRIAGLQGTYIFGDWWGPATGSCDDSPPSRFWSLRVDGGAVTEFQERTVEFDPGGGLILDNLTSFGEDATGEVYICSRGNIWTPPCGTNCNRARFLGEVYKIVDEDDPNPLLIVLPTGTPTVSNRGVLTLVLLLAVAGAVLIARRRPRTSYGMG